jgi:hypothetical protein
MERIKHFQIKEKQTDNMNIKKSTLPSYTLERTLHHFIAKHSRKF